MANKGKLDILTQSQYRILSVFVSLASIWIVLCVLYARDNMQTTEHVFLKFDIQE